jgi:hypothetical protein
MRNAVPLACPVISTPVGSALFSGNPRLYLGTRFLVFTAGRPGDSETGCGDMTD